MPCVVVHPSIRCSLVAVDQLYQILKDHHQNRALKLGIKSFLTPYISGRRHTPSVSQWPLLLIALRWADASHSNIVRHHSQHVLTALSAWFQVVPDKIKVCCMA